VIKGLVASRGGLTLVELLVVLTIVGITSVVVVPAFDRLGQGGAAQATAELVSALHATRDAAASRRVPAVLTLELASGRYWVVVDAPGTAGADTLQRGGLRRTPAIRIGIGRHAGWTTIAYDPLGRSRGGPVYISDDDAAYAIAVDAWNGAVVTRPR